MAIQEKMRREEIVVMERQVTALPEGQVILFEQFTLVRRTWKWVLLVALLVTAAVGAYVYLVMPVEYLASVRALPPNKSGTPLDNLVGGISNTLKDFGLSRLVGKGGAEAGYSKSVLITSQPLFDSLIAKYDLYKVYDIPKNRYDLMYQAIGSNINVDISPEGPITVEVYDRNPERAAAMANDVIRYTNELARDINRRESEPLTKYVGDRYLQARDAQMKLGVELRKFMQKSKIVDPEAQAEVMSSAVMDAETDVAVARTRLEILQTALGKEDPKTIEAEALLRQAESRSQRLAAGRAGTLSGPSINNLPETTVEYLRLRQDYEVNAKVLALLEPMYEQSKYEEMRDIPVLNVLDEARVPPVKARPKRSIILASTFVGAFLIGYVLIALVAYWKSFMKRYRRYSVSEVAMITNGDARGGERS